MQSHYYENCTAAEFAIKHTNGIVQGIFSSEEILYQSVSSFYCISDDLREIKILKITLSLTENIITSKIN